MAYDLTVEEFDTKLSQKISPFMEKGIRGTFTGTGYVTLEYFKYIHPEEIGSIIVLNGRIEYFLKYQEILCEFASKGYSVYTYDHRGQGFSDRLLENKEKGHVDKFQHYVDDLKIFVDEVVKTDSPENLYLFAHSMGGCISAGFLAQNPCVMKKAILSSPMFEMETKPFPAIIAKLLTSFFVLLGRSKDYVISKGAPPEEYAFDSGGESPTGSKVRFDRLTRDLCITSPELKVGGPTWRWMKESYRVTSKDSVLKQAEKIETPLLVFQAEKDLWVKPGGQNYFCDKAQNCTLIPVAESRHEIWHERESIRAPYMEKIFNFLK